MYFLTDEDHTHLLTRQEYCHNKSNWWLTSNKTGSNTVPVEHRSDFKQALSTLQQLKQKGATNVHELSQKSTMGTEFFFFFLFFLFFFFFFFFMVELARFMVDSSFL